jgi:hypothetical protein
MEVSSVVGQPRGRPLVSDGLAGAEDLVTDARWCSGYDGPQAGQCALERAGGLDGGQGLDGADEGENLPADAVGGDDGIHYLHTMPDRPDAPGRESGPYCSPSLVARSIP